MGHIFILPLDAFYYMNLISFCMPSCHTSHDDVFPACHLVITRATFASALFYLLQRKKTGKKKTQHLQRK